MGRADKFIYHDEGRHSLIKIIHKKYYYAKKFTAYVSKNKQGEDARNQTGITKRYLLFFSQPSRLLRNPILGFGMLFMKTCEFGIGGVGYLAGKVKK